ncbi:MAG: winged helix DNA-binding domain-containing protein [Bifidobacteriaceae bacterium]|nr:winged helix DNA-binding domain-containing protein [Bifidobacteriaceae bacterium]
MKALSDAALLRLRIAALGLGAVRVGSPVEVGKRYLAMQGQDFFASLWALGVRSGGTLAQVEAAFNSGELIRSWPMRGTLHVVPAEDIGWMQRLTSARLLGTSLRTRWRRLGLDEPALEKAREVAVAALSEGKALTRDGLLACFGSAGLVLSPQHKYHHIWYLSQTGTLVFGPIRDGEHLLVLADEWITAPRDLDREEGLAEVAARYVASHGPATVEDLAWWCGLGKRAVAEGLALAGDRVVSVTGDSGQTYWVRPETLDQPNDGVLLLPAFDEHLLGYADRSLLLPSDHASVLCPGNNGMFKPAVVVNGVCVGTWKGVPRGTLRKLPADAPVPVAVTGFTATHGKRLPQRLLQQAADNYAQFLGHPAAAITPTT